MAQMHVHTMTGSMKKVLALLLSSVVLCAATRELQQVPFGAGGLGNGGVGVGVGASVYGRGPGVGVGQVGAVGSTGVTQTGVNTGSSITGGFNQGIAGLQLPGVTSLPATNINRDITPRGVSSDAGASAVARSNTFNTAPLSILASRLFPGKSGGGSSSGATCIANAQASSKSSSGITQSNAQSASFTISGAGLGSLAVCGASAQATSTSLSCSRYTSNTNICKLSGQFETSCDGLRLVNPGQGQLRAGQQINVPPCTA